MARSPRRRRPPGSGAVLAAVAAGGVLGALARHGAGLLLAHRPGEFPLATLLVNVSGCLLIGVLVVLVTEVGTAHPLVRPFLGTGVLGGFTTFSTYAVDVHVMVQAGRLPAALGYLGGTVVAAVGATWAGIALTRAAAGAR